MSSIRVRLFFMLLLFAGSSFGLAYVTYNEFTSYRDQRHQLDWSFELRDTLQDIANFKPNSDKVHALQKLRARLLPASRMEQLSDLLQALNEGNARLIRERHQIFMKNETEFERFTRENLDFLEKRLVYYGSLLLVILGLGFVFLQVFIHNHVVRPIHDLSRRMDDFLQDRYTYQFSVPSSDEIGQMQSTFNSLAQRVISNMEQLKTLDQAKSEFLSIASHELRTPLTSIKGSLSLMRSGVVGKINEMAENLMTIAENETDRLIRLINDILDLAKIEARKLPLHQDWKAFNDLLHTCLQSLQGLASQAQVQLTQSSIPPLIVYMDQDRIQQVLTNLLSNAIKFSPQGGIVNVSCQITDKQELLIEVRDHGRGIAPEDQDAIFQKFRQATNSRNPLVKGTGLGLAIARALVEQHGGTIGVRSTPDEGSTFYFTLPEWRYANSARREVAA
jgi:signal transduction histidine kinase